MCPPSFLLTFYRRKWMDTFNGGHVSINQPFVIISQRLMLGSNARPNGRNPDHSIMKKLLSELQLHPLAWAFLQPVSTEEVPDYSEVVKKPMGNPCYRYPISIILNFSPQTSLRWSISSRRTSTRHWMLSLPMRSWCSIIVGYIMPRGHCTIRTQPK